MKLTTEQQAIIDYVSKNKTEIKLTLVDSVAGSGKTTLLVNIAKSISHTNGLYLAYNKAVAVESSRKFPKTTHCMTTHSMAYNATVRPYKLKLGTFTYRDIHEPIPYDMKYNVIEHIRTFCLSRHLTFKEYATESIVSSKIIKIANKYLDLMQHGKIECTHDFYLKFFHVLLHQKKITYPPFDFIMLDEAGDLNEVTLEIFRLLPSNNKIAVGDKYQNIYQFNNTINCFHVLKNEGKLLRMTQSFRVSEAIARRVEAFGQSYLDPKMSFKGVLIADPTIKSRAYLTRTNAALIFKMIKLNELGIPYNLVRKATDIFKIPLMLCGLKYQHFISDPTYKHLQNDVDTWYENDELQTRYKTPLSYIGSLYTEDVQLLQSIRLIQRHGKADVIKAFGEAKKHERTKHPYTLATVHSCKGAEFDEVSIADDLNDSINEVIQELNTTRTVDSLTPNEIESINLYYVAVTRAAKELYNARHL